MPNTRPPYPPGFRRQIIELVRSGRIPEGLYREFEPTAQTIRNWVHQADLYEGCRTDGLTTKEHEEIRRLRRENRQLRLEREFRLQVIRHCSTDDTRRLTMNHRSATKGGANRLHDLKPRTIHETGVSQSFIDFSL